MGAGRQQAAEEHNPSGTAQLCRRPFHKEGRERNKRIKKRLGEPLFVVFKEPA
jgi:hypothetical protein